MKIPKLIKSMAWVFNMDSSVPKPDPLKFSEASLDITPSWPDQITVLTGRLQFHMKSMVSVDVNPRCLSDVPIQLRRALLREVYGEVIEELRDLEYEAYQLDVMCNSTLSKRIGQMITVLETGEMLNGEEVKND